MRGGGPPGAAISGAEGAAAEYVCRSRPDVRGVCPGDGRLPAFAWYGDPEPDGAGRPADAVASGVARGADRAEAAYGRRLEFIRVCGGDAVPAGEDRGGCDGAAGRPPYHAYCVLS